jgi:hypothetical protein
MSDLSFATASSQVYHHHWFALWKPLTGIALLVVLSVGGGLVWLPLGLGLFTLALIGAVSLYLYWSWHTFSFTADNRLVRRRGFLGCTKDVISLFGVVTPYQIPALGQWLDVGNVHLGILVPNVEIRHIARFSAFYNRLVYSVQKQERRSDPTPIYVVVQFPSVSYAGRGWLNQLPSRGP